MATLSESSNIAWPELPYSAWKDTYETLQLWTQIVGKIRLTQTSWLNHSWHVTLYVTARGLTTGVMPYGTRSFELILDLVEHALRIECDDRPVRRLPLRPQSVADFRAELLEALAALDIQVSVNDVPSELPDPIPFSQDRTHSSYDRECAFRFGAALRQADRVLEQFRTEFLGKASPVHFFWGSFDLAVTRFSGRRAPLHPGGVPHLPRAVAQEAYSHEVSSAGFWPGNAALPEAVFYSYAYPEPPGFRRFPLRSPAASFNEQLGEFVLPYAAVREAADPDALLLDFLRDTYAAAADLGGWNRSELECAPGKPAIPRRLASDRHGPR